MTEVCNCGGGHRTRLKINLCVLGCPPAPVYKGWRRGGRPAPRAHPKCGVLLGLQVLVGVHQKEEREKEGEGEKKERGGAAPPLVQFGLGPWGAQPALVSSSLFPLKPTKAHMFPGIPVTPLVLRKIPESLGTFPMSEYSLPIYESLRIDHFETPRHVRDLIRDSEQSSVIKSHNS